MHVAVGAGAVSSLLPMAKAPEAKEGAGPDNDGDSDDVSAAAQAKSATPPGVGGQVDVSA